MNILKLFVPAGDPKGKTREQVTFSVKHNNFLAPQATPKENSNISIRNKQPN